MRTRRVPKPASTLPARADLLTILSLGHGYDADPAHPRLCRPGCGLSWSADRVPAAIRLAGSWDRRPVCRRSDDLTRARHGGGLCRLCSSTSSTILLVALMGGVLLGIALAVLLPEVRRRPAYPVQVRNGVALVGRSTRSLVAAAGRGYGRWLVCHPDHPFTCWKVMREQAWQLTVPSECSPIIEVMLNAECKEAGNESHSAKPIYSNPSKENFNLRFRREREGVLLTLWHSVPAVGDVPSHPAVYR